MNVFEFIYQLSPLLKFSGSILVLCGLVGWFTKPTFFSISMGLTISFGISVVFFLWLFFGFVADKPAFGHPLIYYAQASIYGQFLIFCYFSFQASLVQCA